MSVSCLQIHDSFGKLVKTYELKSPPLSDLNDLMVTPSEFSTRCSRALNISRAAFYGFRR